MGWSWFKFNNLGLALDIAFKFYGSVAKAFKFWGIIPTFVEVTGEKLVRGWGGNRVNSRLFYLSLIETKYFIILDQHVFTS